MKTLITGGIAAQALKIAKAFPAENLILADYGAIPSFNSAKFQLISLGERNDSIIAHHLLTQCLDLQVQLLIPLYDFERDAILRSRLLFEEFNITILLPEKDAVDQYLQSAPQPASKLWAVYRDGKLIYSADEQHLDQLLQLGNKKALNGVFHIHMSADEPNPYLFQIITQA